VQTASPDTNYFDNSTDTCMASGVSVATHKWYSLREARPCILSLFGICERGVCWFECLYIRLFQTLTRG